MAKDQNAALLAVYVELQMKAANVHDLIKRRGETLSPLLLAQAHVIGDRLSARLARVEQSLEDAVPSAR